MQHNKSESLLKIIHLFSPQAIALSYHLRKLLDRISDAIRVNHYFSDLLFHAHFIFL
jgi:hypothetical protein